jgi:hypothetical protein
LIRPPERGSSCPSSVLLEDQTRAALRAFAGFGAPPSSLLGTPAYALRVIARRRKLLRGLIIAWSRNSADAEVYAAALDNVDEESYERGIRLIALASLAVALSAAALALLL